MQRAAQRVSLALAAAGVALASVVPAAADAGRAPTPNDGVCAVLERPYWPPKRLAETCEQCNRFGHEGALSGEWQQWKCSLDPDLNVWELYTWNDACPRCRTYRPGSVLGEPAETDGGLQFNP
ncbi:hypothetical protein GCM10022224_009810 [Nonomuraea antimicrobica]|uniref:Uncharacterized protein n=2 Tax=Nonomuraea antimicrobica TaxID=561173 RepID=A0ABP7B642_9ACTN